MTSIRDVAAALGVSSATVSRAMTGKAGVSDEVRARVLEAAERLNYSPSLNASGLVTGRTRMVGVLSPYIERWYFSTLIAGIEAELSAAGYDVLLYGIASEEARERFFRRLPARKRVDALISLLLPDEHEADLLRSVEVPLAVIGTRAAGFSSFMIDDFGSAEMAVRHLLNLGHTTIGLIGGGTEVPLHFRTPLDRRNGYLRALASAGIPFDPALEANGEFTVLGGERAMNELLAAPTRPTAVFAMSDEMAFGAIRAAERHGLRIPTDMSIIGFDNADIAQMLDLTTISQPLPVLGKSVAASIVEQLGPDAAPGGKHIEFATQLVVRHSTAPPREGG